MRTKVMMSETYVQGISLSLLAASKSSRVVSRININQVRSPVWLYLNTQCLCWNQVDRIYQHYWRFCNKISIAPDNYMSFVHLVSICESMEQVNIVAQQVLPHFMQLTGPVACWQEHTSFYPEPHELSTHSANTSWRSILISTIHT